MMDRYFRQWTIVVSDETIAAVFSDFETLLRLSPRWNIKALRMDGSPAPGRTFEVDAELDRAERTVCLMGVVKSFAPPGTFRLELEEPECTLDFYVTVSGIGDEKSVSVQVSSVPHPVLEDLREYDLWARSILNYLTISRSRSIFARIWKRFLDRWWLRMTQAGKRLVFFVLVADGFSVIFLVAVLLWWKFFSGP